MCGGRAVDCHYKTLQTAARQTEHAPNWKNAPNCRAPNWHRDEVGRAQLDRVKQARVKKDAPKWTGISSTSGAALNVAQREDTTWTMTRLK